MFETVNVDKFINLKISIIMKYIFENNIGHVLTRFKLICDSVSHEGDKT